MKDDYGHGFLGGLLAGLVVGGILAILYAPEKGKKTRKKVGKRTSGWSGKASDVIDSAGDLVDKGRKQIGI